MNIKILQAHPNKYKNNSKADNKQFNQINHICQVIIEKLAGRIEVNSEVGKGSRFTMILPLTVPGSHL